MIDDMDAVLITNIGPLLSVEVIYARFKQARRTTMQGGKGFLRYKKHYYQMLTKSYRALILLGY